MGGLRPPRVVGLARRPQLRRWGAFGAGLLGYGGPGASAAGRVVEWTPRAARTRASVGPLALARNLPMPPSDAAEGGGRARRPEADGDLPRFETLTVVQPSPALSVQGPPVSSAEVGERSDPWAQETTLTR